MKINYKKYDILSWKKFIENGKDIELNGLPILDEEDAAVMVRTGGTTGKPKTVVLSNKNLNEMANQHAKQKRAFLPAKTAAQKDPLEFLRLFGTTNSS